MFLSSSCWQNRHNFLLYRAFEGKELRAAPTRKMCAPSKVRCPDRWKSPHCRQRSWTRTQDWAGATLLRSKTGYLIFAPLPKISKWRTRASRYWKEASTSSTPTSRSVAGARMQNALTDWITARTSSRFVDGRRTAHRRTLQRGRPSAGFSPVIWDSSLNWKKMMLCRLNSTTTKNVQRTHKTLLTIIGRAWLEL